MKKVLDMLQVVNKETQSPLLTWTYFNSVNGGRNILIKSQLKRILFMSSDKKKWNKTEKDRKNMEKENNSDESDFSENEIPD